MPPLELAVNSVTDPMDKINKFVLFNLKILGPVGKFSLTDDNYFNIDDMFSATANNGIKSAPSQNIHSNDFELSYIKDNTSSYNGQVTLCASTGPNEEFFEDIYHTNKLGGTNYNKLINVHVYRHQLTRLQQIFQIPSKSSRE